jgi:hypothetical protein
MKTNLRNTTIMIASLISISAATASAQHVDSHRHRHDRALSPVARVGHYPAWGGYHASTISEGYFRGFANLVRATGDYNFSTSQAAILNEQARRDYMANKVQYAKDHFRLQEINREGREKLRGPRVTLDQVKKISKARLPKRLSTKQFDVATGQLAWPAALADAKYAAERQQISQLMADRSYGIKTDTRRIEQLTNILLAELKSDIRDLSPGDYTQAKGFLVAMKYELRFDPKTLGA